MSCPSPARSRPGSPRNDKNVLTGKGLSQREPPISVTFKTSVYADAVRGVNTRYPFDFASIERKASEALPDWVYRYVSAAAGDGRTQRANIAAFSCYGIVPRMMVSPPERDLSIQLFGKHLAVADIHGSRSGWSACAHPTFTAMWRPHKHRRPPESRTRCRRSRRHVWKT